MNTLLYWTGRAFIAFIQMLPLKFAARLGRAAGALAFYLDKRHRRVALENLTMCFGRKNLPEKSAPSRGNISGGSAKIICPPSRPPG